MDNDFLICEEDDRCVLLAEDFQKDVSKDDKTEKFGKVINDLSRIYPEAVLVGAVAAAKYVRHPERPRETEDIDVLLGEEDFAEFLIDELPEDKLKKLNAYFDTSDSVNHSLKHKKTGIYVDLLSTESNPIRKKISRHVLGNREQATHTLIGDEHSMDILKPELLLAMKINRYCKNPDSEKGRSDYIDIVKIIKTMREKKIPIKQDTIKSFLNDREAKKFDEILARISGDSD